MVSRHQRNSVQVVNREKMSIPDFEIGVTFSTQTSFKRKKWNKDLSPSEILVRCLQTERDQVLLCAEANKKRNTPIDNYPNQLTSWKSQNHCVCGKSRKIQGHLDILAIHFQSDASSLLFTNTERTEFFKFPL